MDRRERELRKDRETTARAVSDTADRFSSRTRALLRQGESLYERELYQQAIHVWTRILFLDRGNVEARQAIDRAKCVIAERQRQHDAELAAASRLVATGDLEEAARKVQTVLSIDPRHREAHQLAERITSLRRRGEPGSSVSADLAAERPAAKGGLLVRVKGRAGSRGAGRTGASRLKMLGFAIGVVSVAAGAAFYLYSNWEAIVSDGVFDQPPALSREVMEDAWTPVVPRASELRYFNGSRLVAKGRYREALAELSLVERRSPVFEDARSLILRIEERLLRDVSESGNVVPNHATPNGSR